MELILMENSSTETDHLAHQVHNDYQALIYTRPALQLTYQSAHFWDVARNQTTKRKSTKPQG